MDDDEHRRRASRREFIRTHHPDRGGDPTEFLIGLPHFGFDPSAITDTTRPRIVFVPHVSWPRRVLHALLAQFHRRQPPRVR